jgi:hypothetical protein
VVILFLHSIVTVVRLAESVVAPNAPGTVGDSVIEKCSISHRRGNEVVVVDVR